MNGLASAAVHGKEEGGAAVNIVQLHHIASDVADDCWQPAGEWQFASLARDYHDVCERPIHRNLIMPRGQSDSSGAPHLRITTAATLYHHDEEHFSHLARVSRTWSRTLQLLSASQLCTFGLRVLLTQPPPSTKSQTSQALHTIGSLTLPNQSVDKVHNDRCCGSWRISPIGPSAWTCQSVAHKRPELGALDVAHRRHCHQPPPPSADRRRRNVVCFWCWRLPGAVHSSCRWSPVPRAQVMLSTSQGHVKESCRRTRPTRRQL